MKDIPQGRIQFSSKHEEIGCCLRNFFISADSNDLLQTYETMGTCVDLPPIACSESFEFAFNRLFVGPLAPVAPPFASVYLDRDKLVMGPSTLDARDLYAALGLSSPWEGSIPDDHVSLEIDGCLHLRQLVEQNDSPQLAELYHSFVAEHFSQWIPRFCDRIMRANDVPISLHAVAETLIEWLNNELINMPKGELL